MAESMSEIEERGIVVTESAAHRIAALRTQEQAEKAFLRIAVYTCNQNGPNRNDYCLN